MVSTVPGLTVSGRARVRGWLNRLNDFRRAMLIEVTGLAIARSRGQAVAISQEETTQAHSLLARAFGWIAALRTKLAAEAAWMPSASAARMRCEPTEKAEKPKPTGQLRQRRRRRDKPAAPDPEYDVDNTPLNEVIGRICDDLCEAALLIRDPETIRKIMAILEAMRPMLRKIAAATYAAAIAAVAVTPAAALDVVAPDTG